jgi:glycosyltransferase involved in cell wall biosynthesis
VVLAEHLHRIGARHIHNHFGDSSCTVAMLASTMSGIPFSFTPHGPAIFFEPRRWRLDEKVARASFVACISHFARAQTMLFSDQAHWNKLHVVHCGVIPEQYGRQKREQYGKHILFVGRLAAVKGVPLLLECVASLRVRHPDLRLTIVGDGPDRVRLEQQSSELGLTESVRFAGYQSQDAVAQIMTTSDVLVLPSFAEGVPVVLMEAMASRLPVVASRVAGVPELVEDGVSGLLLPPGNLKVLAESLDRLLSDPSLCGRMGEAGRAMVEAQFNVATEAALLRRLVQGGERVHEQHCCSVSSHIGLRQT